MLRLKGAKRQVVSDLIKQLGSTAGAAFAAACCAGASWALAALTALGAAFLVNDAVLIPSFAALLGLSLWLLSRSARAHRDLRPLYLHVPPVAARAPLRAVRRAAH